jgi:hypothetical protein
MLVSLVVDFSQGKTELVLPACLCNQGIFFVKMLLCIILTLVFFIQALKFGLAVCDQFSMLE